MKTDEPDELTAALYLSSPKPPASLANQCFAIVRHSIARSSIESGRKEFHNSRISIQRSEWLAVCCEPLTQAKAVGLELNYLGHSFACSFLCRITIDYNDQ